MTLQSIVDDLSSQGLPKVAKAVSVVAKACVPERPSASQSVPVLQTFEGGLVVRVLPHWEACI